MRNSVSAGFFAFEYLAASEIPGHLSIPLPMALIRDNLDSAEITGENKNKPTFGETKASIN
jgi:hypothetical protein